MKIRFNRNLQIGYAFSILILVLVGGFSWYTIENLINSNGWVQHSNLVIQKLENTISIMKDAETGQRGFLLTNRQEFLDPYNGSYQKAVALANELKLLTRDNPRQQQNIGDVKQVLLQRLSSLQALIDKKRAGKIITVDDLKSGKAAMDALRAAVSKAENEEKNLLGKRINTLNRYVFWAPLVIAAAIVLAALIALFSYVRAIRDINEKDRLRDELEIKEQETASLNEELVAANEELASTNEELAAANEELTAINEEYMASNEELNKSRTELESLNNELEEKVTDRTRALTASEKETRTLNNELLTINEELASTNEELMTTNEELNESQEKLQKTVNELVSAKDGLEKSERLFKSIAVNIPKSLVIIIGKDHRFLAVEGDLMVKMGYDSRDYTGKHPAEVSPPERYEATKHLYERVLAGEQFSVERKGAKGEDYRVDFVPLKNEQDEVYAGLIIALDITDIKQAEEKSAKLAAIVETSYDAIIGKTIDGIITSWNKSAEMMFGYTEAEMIGESILKLIPEDRQEEEPQIIARIKTGERLEHFETKRLTRNGGILDVALTISPIRDTQGNIIGVSKIARDISEKKRDELRKNDFIGMVSHEMKTPLTSLTALIQVANVKLKNNGDTFLSEALQKANTQARKMTVMINGFLNVSRLESGKMLIGKSQFNIQELIAESIKEIELTTPSYEIRFKPGKPVMADADRDKIGSVISNLLTNAVKYSPKNKLIEVKCEPRPDYVQVSIKDQGIGIKLEDREKLFDRYYRVESNHTQHISGFGIGLYLSAEIIRHHEGRIWVESEIGKGSVFYFTIPFDKQLS
jgi:PAS domain S-box-containing protein